MLLPLTAAGHRVFGIDRDEGALLQCRLQLERRGLSADLKRGDFTAVMRLPGKFHMALCLGNTLMTIVRIEQAIALFSRIERWLLPGGRMVIDDFPQQLWREVANGNWMTGISPSGDQQLIWSASEPVFTLREGAQVDRRSWSFKPQDRLFRLWGLGELQLLANQARLSAPRHDSRGGLIILRKPARGAKAV
jgi:hypothetical protein